MASVNINMPNFDKNDDWQLYSEQLENFFVINELNDEKKVSILLTQLSPQVYKKLRELCDPVVPKDKSYDELDALMKIHFSKAAKKVIINVFEERRKFFRALQGEKESVSQWFDRVKNLSATCSFGTNVENMLRDKFITGLRNEKMFKQLSKMEATIDINKALQCAVDSESRQPANTNQKKPFVPMNKEPKNDLKQTAQDNNDKFSKSNIVCAHCGETKHDFRLCKNKQYHCEQCGRDGHLAKACHFHSNKTLHNPSKFMNISENQDSTKIPGYQKPTMTPSGFPPQPFNNFNNLSASPKKSGKSAQMQSPKKKNPTCKINIPK